MKKKAMALEAVILIMLLLITGLAYWRIDQEEQNQVKTPILAYLHMNDVYEAVLQETKSVKPKPSTEEQDKRVRDRLLAAYRKILAGRILKSYEDTLRNYTIFSDDYPMLFSDLQKIKINRMQIIRKGRQKCRCIVSLVSYESYNMDLFAPETKTLIDDYQVANFTQAQFDAVLNRCKLIRLAVHRRDIFNLEKTAQGWLIETLKDNIDQSKLSVELDQQK